VKKWFIIAGVIVVAVLFALLNLLKGGSKVEVVTAKVEKRHITKTVSGSGSIQARRQLDVSASAIGKITLLAIKEGDKVLITGFGKFKVKFKWARKGRNPRTGEQIILDSRRIVTFQSSSKLKQKMNRSDVDQSV